MAKARIIIKEGIKTKPSKGSKGLMDPASEKIIKKKIQVAIDAILAGTEYERIDKNPPVFGVEKET